MTSFSVTLFGVRYILAVVPPSIICNDETCLRLLEILKQTLNERFLATLCIVKYVAN